MGRVATKSHKPRQEQLGLQEPVLAPAAVSALPAVQRKARKRKKAAPAQPKRRRKATTAQVEPEVRSAPSIARLLEDALATARTAKIVVQGKKPRDHLYVSEIGTVQGETACHRRLWYDFHDAPSDPLTPDTLLNFEVGDAVGWRVANLLAKGGHVEKVELPVSLAGGLVTGRTDVLLSKDLRVVEIKTATLKQRKYLPKPEHLAQCLLYIHALRQYPAYANTCNGVVLYVYKDPARGQPVSDEFPVPYDEQAALNHLRAFREAFRVATSESLPARPDGFSPSGFPCSYCAYRMSTCWSGLPDKLEGEEVPF